MELLELHEIFELLPTHGKVVTLDADLPMKHALAALAHHDATCLPVWDSALQRFVDVFSCTDLVDIILFAHRTLTSGAMPAAGASAGGSGEAQTALERCHLRDLSGLKRSKTPGFLMASVDDSMAHGALMLKQHGLECLPIGDSNCSSSLLHLLLPEQLLVYLATLPDFRVNYSAFLDRTVGQALLPLCRPLKKVHRGASLIDALALLSADRLHALPVMDDGAQSTSLSQAAPRMRSPPASASRGR
jgi:CBS-domain-containing membrane protein